MRSVLFAANSARSDAITQPSQAGALSSYGYNALSLANRGQKKRWKAHIKRPRSLFIVNTSHLNLKEKNSITIRFSKRVDERKRLRCLTTPVGESKANEAGVDDGAQRRRAALRGLGEPRNRFVCPNHETLDTYHEGSTMSEADLINQ
jgi:hypothetical protein